MGAHKWPSQGSVATLAWIKLRVISLSKSDGWGLLWPWRAKQRNGLTWMESWLLWQLFLCHFLDNSMWQHPTENDIPALSRRVLHLFRSPQISLAWSSGTVGPVSVTQSTHRRMPTSVLVFLGSSLLTGTNPGGSSRQEWHSPMAGWSYSWRP